MKTVFTTILLLTGSISYGAHNTVNANKMLRSATCYINDKKQGFQLLSQSKEVFESEMRFEAGRIRYATIMGSPVDHVIELFDKNDKLISFDVQYGINKSGMDHEGHPLILRINQILNGSEISCAVKKN